jgi:cytochrome c-type biogenesis protein CcmH
MRFIRLLSALALLIAFTAMPAFAGGIVDEIGANLMCQCGCTMVLSTCDCGTAEQMRGEIRAMLDQGKTKSDILDFYVGKYGDKVLSAPKAEGFNISAYITPFIAILASAVIIAFIVRRWVLQTKTASSAPALASPSTAPASMDDLRARMQRELSEYE